MIQIFGSFLSYCFLFSSCSGLVVSGYSKTQIDQSLKTNMAHYIEPYKKFKMMYTVDATGDFKGRFAHYKQAL